jgi:large subunit ribosomal protein L24
MKIRKGDMVMVISGDSPRGTRGKVLMVIPEKNRVIVEGVNFIKRHTRPTQRNPKGGILEKEAPIHVSNVMLLDPKTNLPVRVGTKVLTSEGKKSRQRVRVSKKSGEIISAAKVK